MSLDLDWTLLDTELSARFLDTLNRALESSAAKRPSFLGDLSITGLEFGSQAPEVTIKEVTDVWSDFVTHDDVPLPGAGAGGAQVYSRKGMESEATAAMEGPSTLPFRTYTQFNDAMPPHRVQGTPSVFSGSIGASTPSVHPGQVQQWSAALGARGIRTAGSVISMPTSPDAPPNGAQSPGYFGHWQQAQPGFSQLLSPYTDTSRKSSYDSGRGGPGPNSSVSQVGRGQPPPYAARPGMRATQASFRSQSGPLSPPLDTAPSSSSIPSLQLHLSLLWPTTTFRLTISTSLLINYPSPSFMSLPLQLSVTGFVMRAGVILSLEGEKRRAHICLVEEDEEDAENDSPEDVYKPNHAAKKPSPGLSILPSITFDSEVGQSDKHALRNVGKVEKFIAEVLRKGLEDELVFPNYYTIDLPPSS